MPANKTGNDQLDMNEFSAEDLRKADQIIAEHKDKPGSLIPTLEKLQELLGYLPPVIQQRVAKGLDIHPATVYGVVTFYSFFTMVPRGRHNIRVCLGTACYVRGGQKILEKLIEMLGIQPGECTADRRFSLETVRCLGACGLAPAIVIDADTHGQVKTSKLEAILAKYP